MKTDAEVCRLTENLLAAGIYSASLKHRTGLARELVERGDRVPTAEELGRLMERASTARSPAGLATHWLRNGSWVGMVETASAGKPG